MWVLTGDKLETAVNIAYSCDLLSESVPQIVVDCTTMEEAQNLMQSHLINVQQQQYHNIQRLEEESIQQKQPRSESLFKFTFFFLL